MSSDTMSSDASASSGSERSSPAPASSKKRKAAAAEIEVDVNAPEPPSKKAQRRLKKGKPAQPAAADAADDAPRSAFGVWIGNLPWTLSRDDLRSFITTNAALAPAAITRLHMPKPEARKPAGRAPAKTFHNKGFAYVDLATAADVAAVLPLSEKLLGGRAVLIKDHRSFDGRPAAAAATQREDGVEAGDGAAAAAAARTTGGKTASKRVFLGNLGYDTTEEILQEHFSKCGDIATVKVATFEDSGKCKGYAWITFEDVDGARNAVQGFVRIAEEDDDENEEEEEEEDDDDDNEHKSEKVTKKKTRKWWVNRLRGRPLRMEFAEDDQVRYKKRFGKDGTKRANDAEASGEVAATKPVREKENDRPKNDYRQPYAPRLTGGIIESKGKKTTF